MRLNPVENRLAESLPDFCNAMPSVVTNQSIEFTHLRTHGRTHVGRTHGRTHARAHGREPPPSRNVIASRLYLELDTCKQQLTNQKALNGHWEAMRLPIYW